MSNTDDNIDKCITRHFASLSWYPDEFKSIKWIHKNMPEWWQKTHSLISTSNWLFQYERRTGVIRKEIRQGAPGAVLVEIPEDIRNDALIESQHKLILQQRESIELLQEEIESLRETIAALKAGAAIH